MVRYRLVQSKYIFEAGNIQHFESLPSVVAFRSRFKALGFGYVTALQVDDIMSQAQTANLGGS